MASKTLVVFIVALVVGAQSIQAGTFEVTDVFPITSSQTYHLGVEMRATARYIGTLDPNDNGYLIQTFINDNRSGGLDDWNNPDHWGDGKSGTGIFAGMILTCSGSCAAYANLWRLQCPQTYNYKGKGGVVIYHQFSPEIDIDYSAVYLVDCYAPQPPPPRRGEGDDDDGCGPGGATVTTMTSIETGATLSEGSGTYSLNRRDVQDEIRYLLEEWTVVSLVLGSEGSSVVETLKSSSDEFGSAVAARFRDMPAPESAGTVLVVEGVDHPRNSRHVPTPSVRLRGRFAGGSPGQELVVRADFARRGNLVELQVIHSTEPVAEELLAELRNRLMVVNQGPGRHRTVSFVILDLGDPVTIRSSQAILPLCCCYTDEGGGVWCP